MVPGPQKRARDQACPDSEARHESDGHEGERDDRSQEVRPASHSAEAVIHQKRSNSKPGAWKRRDPIDSPEHRDRGQLENTDQTEYAKHNPQQRVQIRRHVFEPELLPLIGDAAHSGIRHRPSKYSNVHLMSASFSELP